MKYLSITGRFLRENTRFLGDPHDTIIGAIECDDGRTEIVKGKEFSTWAGAKNAVLVSDECYTFFGSHSSYKSRSGYPVKQFAYFGYCEAKHTECVEQLHGLLLGRSFPRELACRLVHEYGQQAVAMVRRNPYLLMRYDRVGFKRCDMLWLDLKLPPGRLKRQTLCLANGLDGKNGSIWYPASEGVNILRESLTCAIAQPEKAIALGRRAGLIACNWTDGIDGDLDSWEGDFQWITSGNAATKEREIAEMLACADSESVQWPVVGGRLSDHQARELRTATRSAIGVLIGGGGTGKTFTVAELVKAIASQDGGTYDVMALAPTGKAAVRMTEALASQDVIGLRGMTIHSALLRSGGDLDCSTLIVDESSMIDQDLMHALLKARRPGTRTLFVGDPYQLSPVGAGAPFRDMVDVLPAVGQLTEIRRNAGTIALAGQSIRHGLPFGVDDKLDLQSGNNLILSSGSGQQAILNAIAIAMQAMPDIDPVYDIQVIGVVNRNSETSVSELNSFLQQHFNGDAEPVRGTPFRVKDKVIQTSNSWMIPDQNRESDDEALRNKAGHFYVANGEIGEVVEVDWRGMVVRVLSPDRYVRVYTKKVEEGSEEGQTGSDFQHAYAVTTHKSQGSQWPVVIAVIDDSSAASRLMDRSLIYTMITRASKACVIVGNLSKAHFACRRATIDKRKTFLKELYRAESSAAVS